MDRCYRLPIAVVRKISSKGKEKGQGGNQRAEWIWMSRNFQWIFVVVQVQSFVQKNIYQARQGRGENGFKDSRTWENASSCEHWRKDDTDTKSLSGLSTHCLIHTVETKKKAKAERSRVVLDHDIVSLPIRQRDYE